MLTLLLKLKELFVFLMELCWFYVVLVEYRLVLLYETEMFQFKYSRIIIYRILLIYSSPQELILFKIYGRGGGGGL